MKVSVIGAINYDYIIPFDSDDSEKKEGLGGILYNVVALASISPGLTICPISKVGQDTIQEVMDICTKYPNIDTSGIKHSPKGTNINYLKYVARDRREEILKSNITPIEINHIEPYLDSDIILFNFVSGFEIHKDTIKLVKEKSKALLLMDVHNLAFGMDEQGRRFPRQVKNWKEWVENVDVIQLNEHEYQNMFCPLYSSLNCQLSIVNCRGQRTSIYFNLKMLSKQLKK